MMLQLRPKSDQLNRLSVYYAVQLLTKQWMQPTNEQHEIFPVTVTRTSAPGLPAETSTAARAATATITAYAVRRPDKQWALLAINKNPKRAAQLNVQFNIPGANQPLNFFGPVQISQFSRKQYVWHADGSKGYPLRSLPPAQITRDASSAYELPPYSLSVIRGKIAD